MSVMLSDCLEFVSSVRDGLKKGSYLDRTPKWICDYTHIDGKNWSFKDHEFQLAIVSEPSREMAVQKCSQVGISEVEIRKCMSFLCMNPGRSAIFTLPTATLSLKFSKSRVDPVIDQSKFLSKLVKAGSNGSDYKQIGTSGFYLGGAQTTAQAISIPADYLVHDEIDFSNQAALSAYESRITHSNFKIRRKVSTPTVTGYGINKELEDSTKNRYACRCSHCEKVVFVDFFNDVVIPGLDKPFSKFDASDLKNPKYKIEEAYLACPLCRRNIEESLRDSSRRQWVKEHPEREVAGYYIRPFDLMKYNPTVPVIKRIRSYRKIQDYHNFTHGVTYTSDENEVNLTVVESCKTSEFLYQGSGYYMGVDVGKKLYVTIGKHVGDKFVIVAYHLVNASEDTAGELKTIYDQYGCYRMVIDAAPEWSLCRTLMSLLGSSVNACVYVKENARKPGIYTIKEEDNMLLACRTSAFNLMVSEINKRKFIFPMSDVMITVKEHLHGMKKVEEIDENEERVSTWAKIGEDHYFHSTMYCWLASMQDEPDILDIPTVCPITVVGAQFASDYEIETGMSVREALALAGISFARRS